jgi:hypothetical protein
MNDFVIRGMFLDIRHTEQLLATTLNDIVSRGDTMQVLVMKAADLEAFSGELARKAAHENHKHATSLLKKRIAVSGAALLVIGTVLIYIVFVP